MTEIVVLCFLGCDFSRGFGLVRCECLNVEEFLSISFFFIGMSSSMSGSMISLLLHVG